MWWWSYIAVAIAPITAISKQYMIIGNMSISISSTISTAINGFLL